MLKKRLIAVLILRYGQVVQSVQFKHTNIIHWKASTAVDFFDHWSVDEMVVLDVSRDTEKRDAFYEAVKDLSKHCFVPLSVGGWIDSVEEARKLLRLGGDKVVINTQALEKQNLIGECAEVFGSQCVVVSVDARKNERGEYEVCVDRGRNPTGLSPWEWAKECESRGAGEIFLNSMDHDGFRQGYDLDLLKKVVEAVRIPVIAMGGVFKWEHLVEGIQIGGAEGVAAANIFHYTEHSTKKAKIALKEAGIDVR